MRIDKYGQKALDLIKEGRNLFITGKAGTGKTTLLKELVKQLRTLNKLVAVTAPTGVAAHNANGVTLHSLLRLPLSPYLPGIKIPKLYTLKEEEIKVVRKLEVLIIDEVSMVRCDMMDAADDILRHYRKSTEPFGGVQVVMFGDLYQLMPVADEEEENQLTKYYKSLYFFGSKVMETFDYSMLELKTIYRQDNRGFVNLLNDIRKGRLTPEEQEELDRLYHPRYREPKGSQQIVLTTHNWKSRWLNSKKLEAMDGKEWEYKAYTEGYFPIHEHPTNYKLKLKVGARVMFIRNAASFFNGMLGTIAALHDESIDVRKDEDGEIITVERMCWDYERYHINKKSRELEIEKVGTFIQYPLKLAWAITIHKSQGLTLENVIIDAGKAFAAGQVYVALSRCKWFDKIVLMSRITPKAVMIDPTIQVFLKSVTCVDVDSIPQKKIKGKAKKSKISDTLRKTLDAFKQGLSPEEIAIRRRLVPSTIYEHLAQMIETGDISVFDLIAKEKVEQVEKVIIKAGTQSLSQIKQHLPEEMTYSEIKLGVAHYISHSTQEQANK